MDLHAWIAANTAGCETVVEFGSGRCERLAAVHPTVRRRIGLEAFRPYILDARNVGGPHGVEQIETDMRAYRAVVPPEAHDCAMFIDSLEHLDRPDAEALMRDVMVDFRRVLLFVPEGNHPQTTDAWGLGEDHWQTHRSTWYEADVRTLGFEDVVVVANYHDDPNKDPGTIFATWTRPAEPPPTLSAPA
jgi:hypothetical protein